MRACSLCMRMIFSCSAVIMGCAANADFTLMGSADIVQPTTNSTYQANASGYAEVGFESTNTSVMVTGGTGGVWVSVEWNMMIGWDEGNQAVASDIGSYVFQLEGRGEWRREVSPRGENPVTVGVRHARYLAEIWVPGAHFYSDHSHEYGVVGQQQDDGGGGS